MTEVSLSAFDLPSPAWPGLERAPHSPVRAGIARAIVRRAVDQLRVRVTFPDGTSWGRGDGDAPEMVVARPDAMFARLGTDMRIGFGEAYMVGDWTTGPRTDLADLLRPFAERLSTLVPEPLQRLRRFVDVNLPSAERNTVEGSRDNISRHYDLSNDLFSEFLDPTMTYSAAWFDEADTSADLETAQQRKMDGILDYAGVGEGTRMLEIGTGWGALALRAAERGAHVTTVTISREQADLARERFEAAGVADRIDLRLQDYREVTGQYDAIVSVEMIEAVGEEYWPTYFSTLDRLLAPGGRIAIQAILMEHHRLLATRRSYGWIQKYIFPGGLIPSLQAIDEVLGAHTSLRVLEQRSLDWHYARTLRLWRERFIERWDDIEAQGFDPTFRRMWEFYLAYCEAGFAAKYLDVQQLSIGRDPAI